MATKPGIRPTEVIPKSDKPPASWEELRALLLAIARGNSTIVLGIKARAALGKILDLQGDPALLSITSLSAKVDTTPSTITRLARNLGYEGFSDFQKVLFASSGSESKAFYLNQAQSALNSHATPNKQRAAQLCHENQANIEHFVEAFDSKNFEYAVDLITNAQRVTAFGIRQFHSLAAFLVYGLRLIRSDVSLLDANSLGLAEELGSMNIGDVCIVASVSPYSRQIIEVASIASESGIDVIALTDRASSPLVDHSKPALFAQHESCFISNSITSFFSVAEGLINAVASANPEPAESALIERQKLIERFNIEKD